jgi:hypothetical protein
MSNKAVMAVCTLAMATLASPQQPHLQPRVILPGEGAGRSFWLLAPDLAIVRIQRAQRQGPDIVITPHHKLTVHLVAVDAEVEDTIQGQLPKGPTRFYFFTNSLLPGYSYTTPLSWFYPGKRYVVFLREDGGVLRTMADLTEPNIQIRSGSHQGTAELLDRVSARDPGVVIAWVALTPSSDYEPGFAKGIQDAFDRLLLIASPGKIAPFLRALLTHRDRAVRERACLVLSTSFSYRDPCFEDLARSDDPQIKNQAVTWARGKAAAKPHLLRALREDPLSLSISNRVEDLGDDLGLFTFDLDDEVRQDACGAVRRLFPARDFPNCAK